MRIAQGRLRLGVGDATLVDALSMASRGDRSLRPRIERAYSFCSDLGLVAEMLLSRGPDALDRIQPTPGRPVLSALAERLPTAGAIMRFFSFQETVRLRRKHGVEKMEILYPLRHFVFDLLLLDGEDLTPLSLQERAARLREVVREQPDGCIFITPQLETDDPEELGRFLEEMERRGLEGALVKRPEAPYHAGARRFNWVKLKRGYAAELAETFDVVVVGYYRGRGKRAKLGIGSLLTAVYDPKNDRYRTVSRVGSGLTEEEWVRFREMLDATWAPERPRQVDSELTPDVWVEPRYVIEVIAGPITRSPRHSCGKVGKRDRGYSLRFPRMYRFRFDRRPEDATTEDEVVKLYHSQPQRPAEAA